MTGVRHTGERRSALSDAHTRARAPVAADRHLMTGQLMGVIVTYRRPLGLDAMIDCLLDDPTPLARLVVVDHEATSSTRATVERYRRSDRPVHHVITNDNLGPAGGFAIGMTLLLDHAEDRDWIMTLSDDGPPHRPIFADLLAAAERCAVVDPMMGGLGLAGARLSKRRGRLVRLSDAELNGLVPVDYLGGGQFPLYRAGALRSEGVHRPELFFGFEELDQGVRLVEAGRQLYVEGALLAEARRHYQVPSVRRTRSNGSWRSYYSARNFVTIMREHAPRSASLIAAGRYGLVGPAVAVATRRRTPSEARLAARGAWDGWNRRLGKTIEPVSPTDLPPQ